MKESHMNPEEALNAALDLQAKHSIGMHWGTFILTTEQTEEPRRLLNDLMMEKGIDRNFFETLKPGEVYYFEENLTSSKR